MGKQSNKSTIIVITLICIFLLEAAFRLYDGWELSTLEYSRRASASNTALSYVQSFSETFDLNSSDFNIDPIKIVIRDNLPKFDKITDPLLQKSNILAQMQRRKWNEDYVKNAIRENNSFYQQYLSKFPILYYFKSPTNSPYPRYRLVPNDPRAEASKSMEGIITNNFGYRGKDLKLQQRSNTIRIAFLGASTTISAPSKNFSYPDYLQKFLDQWVKKKNIPVNFEIINAAREGIRSFDIKEIAAQELAGVRPDIVIYMEGANHLYSELKNHVTSDVPFKSAAEHAQIIQRKIDKFKTKNVGIIERYSAFGTRILNLISDPNFEERYLTENKRHNYNLSLPDNRFISDNILGNNLTVMPLGFNKILNDLDEINSTVSAWGGNYLFPLLYI